MHNNLIRLLCLTHHTYGSTYSSSGGSIVTVAVLVLYIYRKVGTPGTEEHKNVDTSTMGNMSNSILFYFFFSFHSLR